MLAKKQSYQKISETHFTEKIEFLLFKVFYLVLSYTNKTPFKYLINQVTGERIVLMIVYKSVCFVSKMCYVIQMTSIYK